MSTFVQRLPSSSNFFNPRPVPAVAAAYDEGVLLVLTPRALIGVLQIAECIEVFEDLSPVLVMG